MRIKNIKTGLEGKATDIPFWNSLIEKTADHNDRVYYCNLKKKECSTPIYKGCAYQMIFEVLEDAR